MKIENLVNIKSVEAFCDAKETKKGFSDADAGAILLRNLEYVSPKLLEKQYADNTLLASGFTINNEGGYNELLSSLRITVVGKFASTEDNGNDAGKISAKAAKSSLQVIGRHAFSAWTKTQVKQYESQGSNLPSTYIAGHLEIYNQEVDEIGYTGIADAEGSVGLLNHPDFVTDVAANTAANLTGQELYDELAGLVTAQRTAVKNTTAYQCDTMVMPTDVMNAASTKILNSAGSTKTVLTALEENFKGAGNIKAMNFFTSFRCDDVEGESITAVYSTDEQAIQIRIPVPLQFDPITQVASKYHVASDYRIGGADVLEIKAGRLKSGL